jgi:hypothetical protein
MWIVSFIAALSSVLLASAGMLPAAPPQPPKPRNVIFIMSDGLRWQDVFRGADRSAMSRAPAPAGAVSPVRNLFRSALPACFVTTSRRNRLEMSFPGSHRPKS